MYLNVLPILTKLDDKIHVPKVYYANSKSEVIIMEDLNMSGWALGQINLCNTGFEMIL